MNDFTDRFNVAKMRQLVEDVPTVFAQVRTELLAFAAFLGQSVINNEARRPSGSAGHGGDDHANVGADKQSGD